MTTDPDVQAHFDRLRLAQLDKLVEDLTEKDKDWQDMLDQSLNRGHRVYADENWFAVHGSKVEARDAKQAAKEHVEHHHAMLDALGENLRALRAAEQEREQLSRKVDGGYQCAMGLEV